MSQKISHVHKDVAKVAQEACNELYDVVMGDNLIYAEWKRQNPGASEKTLRSAFVAKNWGKCIPFARATMARMLSTPLDEALKERILEALILDNQLRRGRVVPATILGELNG